MSSAALPAPVLADRIPKSLARDVGLVIGVAALTAVLAQIRLPLPFSPVPITGQTFAVLLGAAALGPLRGSLAQALYWVVGLAGIPVFTGLEGGWEVATGVTGGYLFGFIVASVVVGAMARRGVGRKPVGMTGAFIAGSAVIYAFGVPWLAYVTGMTLAQALWQGVALFVVGDAIKAVLAGATMPAAWRLVDR